MKKPNGRTLMNALVSLVIASSALMGACVGTEIDSMTVCATVIQAGKPVPVQSAEMEVQYVIKGMLQKDRREAKIGAGGQVCLQYGFDYRSVPEEVEFKNVSIYLKDGSNALGCVKSTEIDVDQSTQVSNGSYGAHPADLQVEVLFDLDHPEGCVPEQTAPHYDLTPEPTPTETPTVLK